MFLKKKGSLVGNYKFGIIESVEISSDGKIRIANVKYRNHKEGISRTTWRTVRELVMIHLGDELNLMQELGEIVTYTDMKCRLAYDFLQFTPGNVPWSYLLWY